MLINLDLKQIEVCVFAQLSRPKLLIDLLNEGKDIHKYIGANVYDKREEGITSDERNSAKTSSFGIIYGNGARTLSERTGRTLEWSGKFIETFFGLFPEAKDWQEKNIQTVEKTGQLTLFTGQVLKFKKYPAKFAWQIRKGIVESYNPPDIKNHPVQHIAWIIMSIFLQDFYKKAVHKRNKYLLINTVHDSIMLDCRPQYLEECLEDKVPELVYTKFSEKLIVPIKADISYADNWYDL